MDSLSEKARLVADRYEDLYFRRNGKTITVKCTSPGWYTLLHEGQLLSIAFQRHRLSELEMMANRMEKMVAELETAAKREGFVILAIPPRNAKNRNVANKYLAADGVWLTDKSDPAVEVYELATTASIITNELNSRLPFEFAMIEPF